MESLDFPDMGQLSPARGVSVSPLQSLVLMNNSLILHSAEKFAKRAESAEQDLSEQIRFAVRQVWSRDPSDPEIQALEQLATQHGLTAVCRVLLNSNEFLFVE